MTGLKGWRGEDKTREADREGWVVTGKRLLRWLELLKKVTLKLHFYRLSIFSKSFKHAREI